MTTAMTEGPRATGVAFSPLVGWRLGGACLTPGNDHAPDMGTLGRPVWGPLGLLSDLELRLGLGSEEAPPALREQRWALRLDALAPRARFYARSHGVDRLGTAAAVLALRDVLLDAGWDGRPVQGGGPRLEALAELEAVREALPPGRADRLARVDRELADSCRPAYDELFLAEAEDLWPGRWRRVLGALRRAGTSLRMFEPAAVERAPVETDLGRLQASILGEPRPSRSLAGDGSLVLLRAPTSWELAEALAALLRAEGSGSIAIIRGGEHAALDVALGAQGLPALGSSAASAHRPALQVLSLAMELAFEPRDPYRVLELLTLPIGPLQGLVGWSLARVIVRAPGIGGPQWRAATEWLAANLAERTSCTPQAAARRLARVSEWLERPGAPRGRPAPRPELLAICRRVEDWLLGRMGTAKDDAVLATAHAQARELRAALAADARDELTLVEVRALVDRVTARGLATRLVDEHAGRIDHVDDPGALLVSRDDVVFWHADAAAVPRVREVPFEASETAALTAAGVLLPDLDRALAEEDRAWRRAVLGARRRLILAVPDAARGRSAAPHPLWYEIIARLGVEDDAIARLTVTARRLRAGRVPVAAVKGPLPEARPAWRLPAGSVPRLPRHSASSLDALLRCPLRSVLERGARLSSGAVAALPPDHVIAGNLGHRLVQTLHELGLLGLPPEEVEAHAREILERLLEQEGAPWLVPGRSFDREQWSELLVRAARELARGLASSGMASADVEKEVSIPWADRELFGRIDLLVRDRLGRTIVIDLKWGARSHRERLESGSAIQLALYARAAGAASAAYFALKPARFLTVEEGLFAGVTALAGPSLEETWDRAEHTAVAVEAALARGEIPVTGVSRSPGLPAALGIPEAEVDRHFPRPEDPCEHCALGAVCGRSWEVIR